MLSDVVNKWYNFKGSLTLTVGQLIALSSHNPSSEN